MPTGLDTYLALLIKSEQGHIQRSWVHWSMLSEGFSEQEIMSVQAQAREMGYTASHGWGPDRLTEKGRNAASS